MYGNNTHKNYLRLCIIISKNHKNQTIIFDTTLKTQLTQGYVYQTCQTSYIWAISDIHIWHTQFVNHRCPTQTIHFHRVSKAWPTIYKTWKFCSKNVSDMACFTIPSPSYAVQSEKTEPRKRTNAKKKLCNHNWIFDIWLVTFYV